MNAATKLRAAEPPASNRRTTEQLVAFVLEAWGESVESIIRIGVRLETAKAEAGHGNWLKVLAGLKMSQSQALKYMRVANCDNIANAQSTACLPNKIEILDTFRHLSPDSFTTAVGDGRVNPGMKINEALALRPNRPRKPRKPKAAPQQLLPDPIAACLIDVLRVVNDALRGTPTQPPIERERRDELFTELHALIDRRRQTVDEEDSDD